MKTISIEIPEELAQIFDSSRIAYIKAIDKHPNFASNLLEMCVILNEEAGEVNKAVLDRLNCEGTTGQIKSELYDTIAVCYRALIMLKHA